MPVRAAATANAAAAMFNATCRTLGGTSRSPMQPHERTRGLHTNSDAAAAKQTYAPATANATAGARPEDRRHAERDLRGGQQADHPVRDGNPGREQGGGGGSRAAHLGHARNDQDARRREEWSRCE